MLLLEGTNHTSVYCDINDLAQESYDWLIAHSTCSVCGEPPDTKRGCCQKTWLRVDAMHGGRLSQLASSENKRQRSKEASAVRKNRSDSAEGFYRNEDIDFIYYLQAGRCYYCSAELIRKDGSPEFHIDHMIPLSLGGTQWPSNLCLACSSCNVSKGQKTLREFWAQVRKAWGKDIVAERQRANRKHPAPKKRLTDQRKRELQAIYLKSGTPFEYIHAHIQMRDATRLHALTGDVRGTVYVFIEYLFRDLVPLVFGRNLSQLNKGQKLTTVVAQLLAVEAMHNVLEQHYGTEPDFKRRFGFGRFCSDARYYFPGSSLGSEYIGRQSSRSSSIFDRALEETDGDCERFTAFLHAMTELLDQRSANELSKVVQSFLNIYPKYRTPAPIRNNRF